MKKNKPFPIILTDEDKKTLKKAAIIEKLTLGAFVRRTSLLEADRILEGIQK